MSARSWVRARIMAPVKETMGLPLAYCFLALGRIDVSCGNPAPFLEGPLVLR